MKEMGVELLEPAILYCDNKVALHIADPIYQVHTKHIDRLSLDKRKISTKIGENFSHS